MVVGTWDSPRIGVFVSLEICGSDFSNITTRAKNLATVYTV